MQGQCIIPPLFRVPKQCQDPAFPTVCASGVCCPADNTCRADSRCCPAGYPIDCSPQNVCCPAGTQCGPDGTCTSDGGGGGNCTCYCPDNAVCTTHADCGVDSYGIPNVCGCPVGCS